MTSTEQSETAPVLVFSFGNPSRGDDALGPAIADLLQENVNLENVELLTDFQLQIEHAVDLERRSAVLFIDASVSCPAPYAFHQLQPERDDSYTTHAMSPAAVLSVYQRINQQQPPPSYLLTIRGYEFDLGKAKTARANENLYLAFSFVKALLETSIEEWSGLTRLDQALQQ